MPPITTSRPPTTDSLRIGVLAPPWVAVPPVHYGGTELILDVLCRGLDRLGHHVELFTVAESTCEVDRKWLFDHGDPDRMGAAAPELRHVAAGYDALAHCDIVHDHTLVGLFLSQLRPGLQVVATNHGPFNEELTDLYERTAHIIPLIAISRHQASTAPPSIPVARVIHHGIDLDRYSFDPVGGDGLVFLGRMNPDKGIDVAIEVARRARMHLTIAAKMREPGEHRYYAEVIEPLLGSDVEFVGEVDHRDKVELLSSAKALINPLQWPEPFGLVMPEALACGTPVVGTPVGATPEIIEPGVSGFIATEVDDLVDAVKTVDRLSRAACHQRAAAAFSLERMAKAHESFYRAVLDRTSPLERRMRNLGDDLILP